ncbi:MAG: mevalonate kinase family protein [Polyangiaceae bacterium]
MKIGPRVVVAPGKMLLTGAYAVLEGAPAVVIAIDRLARAEVGSKAEKPTAEVTEALGEKAPACDASALYEGEKKLGLGSSGAVLVASLGADWIARGNALDDDARARIFARSRDAHAAVQGGGSGVDLAASTYGGVLRYTLHASKPWVTSLELPFTLHWRAYFSGTSARTSELRAKVSELKERDKSTYEKIMVKLCSASELAATHLLEGSGRGFVDAARVFAEAVEQLGEDADAAIVPLEFRRLGVVAATQNAVFFPSGAGGGDVGVYLGTVPPSDDFEARAEQLGMRDLHLKLDTQGVRRQMAAPPPEN